ncbi:MAG: glycosyltransferase family 39 protein [Candidatus Levyibacteriota bacterium]
MTGRIFFGFTQMIKKLFLPLFIIILFFGTFLRFYQLGAIPASLDWDEVSWGYNAYSILQTGKDEYGAAYPLSFRAFGDYKQPVYVYIATIPVAFFGLTPFATRFPSAFLGSLSIIFVFLLTYEIFQKQRYARTIALLTMLFYAISPWSIQFSRVAYEANVGLFFLLLGSWLFIRGFRQKRHWYLFAGVVAMSVSAYTYHSDKLFAPLLFVALLLYGWKYFMGKKVLIVGLIILFGFCNIFWVADSRTTARGRSVLFTADQAALLSTPLQEMQYDHMHGDKLGELLHNRRLVYANQYIKNYLQHFNPEWLFLDGNSDSPRHHTPGMGVLYLIDLPFILIVIFYLLRYQFSTASILFFWLLFAPAASALAVDAPNASRSLIFLPTWQIFVAFGWWFAFSAIDKKKLKLLFALPILLLLFSFIYFVHQYFVNTNQEVQKDWQYGYKEAVDYAVQYQNTNKNVFFSKDFEQPYIFYLFYTKYDPAKYIATGGSSRLSQKCFRIDKAYFGDCTDKIKFGDIYIKVGEDSSEKGKVLKQITYSYGEPAVTIYQHQ